MQWTFVVATISGALALWMLLPRKRFRGRRLGSLLGLVSLGLFASQVPLPGGPAERTVFIVLAGVTLAAAVCTVTFRSPVYCAVWFGLTLLGVSGLFLFQGAQFLSVATVTVYAGAIVVMFLFVLMLSDPRGRTYYDRLSWEAMLSASAGAVMIGVLSMTLHRVFVPEAAPPAADASNVAVTDASGASANAEATNVPALPEPPTSESLQANILAPEHVARLGGALFSRYLVTVEAAGVLLLVALVGATSIMAHARFEQLRRSRHGNG